MKEPGRFVKANFGSCFMQSLLNDGMTLSPGNYCIMIDPIWHESTDNDPSLHKKVLLDVYAPEGLLLERVSHADGLELLSQSLKHAALHLSPDEKKQRYLQERPDYTDVIRVQDLDLLKCWYGFIYTNNRSQYLLEEEMRP